LYIYRIVLINNETNAVDELINEVRGNMWEYFVRKWTGHKCSHQKCSLCLIMDGLWKLFRSKCILGNIFIKNTEFGDIDSGCRATPARNSYYCTEHSNNEIKFSVGDKLVSVNPTLITASHLCKYIILLDLYYLIIS